MSRKSGRNRRRGRRNRRQESRQAVQPELVEDDGLPEKPGPGSAVLEESVLEAAKAHGLDSPDFREGGYKCNRCDFHTRKRGTSGLQSLRAHSRRHVNDRRAWRNPLLIHGGVLVLSVALAVAGLLLDLEWAFAVPSIPADLVPHLPWIIAGTPAALGLYIAFTCMQFAATGNRRLIRRIESGILAGDLIVLLAAATWSTLYAQGVHWVWMTPVAVPPLLALAVAPMKNVVRLHVERRSFRPGGYTKVFRARTTEGDDELESLLDKLGRPIRDGRLVVSDLNRGQREFLRKLGLDQVGANPNLVRIRLAREAQKERAAEPRRRDGSRPKRAQTSSRPHG